MTHNTTLHFDSPALANQLFGPQNAHLDAIAQAARISIHSRGSSVTLQGPADQCRSAASLLTQLYELAQKNITLDPKDLPHAVNIVSRSPAIRLAEFFLDPVLLTATRKKITPKTLSQREYVHALRHHDMIFGVGPAGTGKTYLAVAMALSMLLQKRVKRIILTRPAVEAGERLGFLPGDMAQKVNPYLRPLYDALHDMLDAERVAELLEVGTIEIAPLAFMRGRTLSDACIILDEAQNTTPEQMQMFLTRLGFGSRAVVTGDMTQIDLPHNGSSNRSGLVHALKVIQHIDAIAVVHFSAEDVIRHPLVGSIINAYAEYHSHS